MNSLKPSDGNNGNKASGVAVRQAIGDNICVYMTIMESYKMVGGSPWVSKQKAISKPQGRDNKGNNRGTSLTFETYR